MTKSATDNAAAGRPDATLAFRLSTWRRDAQQLATCTGCYGSGADRHAESRACTVCRGSGKAAREPHVVELVDLVLGLDAALLDEKHARAEQADRAAELEGVGAGLAARVDTLSQMLHATLERADGAERRVAELEQRVAAAADLVDGAAGVTGQLEQLAERALRAELEVDQLRTENDRVRGELYRARHAEQRARQQGFDAGCDLVRQGALELVDRGLSLRELRAELAQAVRGES